MHQEMLEQLDKELEDLQTQLANKENDLNLTEVEIERDQIGRASCRERV